MRFFISGELDSEISDIFRPIRQDVEHRLNEELGRINYGPDVEKIALIPIILGSRFKLRKERRLIQHKSKCADYRLIINFEQFLKGTEQDRKTLLINNLLESISDISRKLGSKFEGEQLTKDVMRLFQNQG